MERLEKLQERQSGNHFANLTGIRVESADEMGVTLALDLHTGVTSHLGFAHAGALYTLAENAAGAAAFHCDARRSVTQTGSIQYLANQKTGTIRAAATVVHHGRATCMVRTEVTGQGGKLLCMAEFTLFCVE